MFIFYFIIGCLAGSFFTCHVERLIKNIPLLIKRSFCFSCQHPLNFWDLIPLFSQLLLKGKCRYCQKSIAKFYFITELFCGCLAVLYYYQIVTLQQLIIIYALYFMSFCDLYSKSFPFILWLIPFTLLMPNITFPLLLFFLLLAAVISQNINIGIGSGDFLVLALLCIDLRLTQLLWTIQIASLLGIIYFKVKKENESIAFIPFLTFSYLIILIINFL